MLGVALLVLALVFVIYSIENMKRARYSAALIMTTVGAICFLISIISMAVVIFFNLINELAYAAALLWVAGTALISMGQVWKINSFKKIYGSLWNVLGLSSSKWSLTGMVLMLLGIPIYLLFFFQTVATGFNWYTVGSETIWIVVFVCLTIAERRLFLVSSAPSLKIIEAKMVQNDVQTLVAYSNLTNSFLAHIIPVIGASGVEDTISQCIEEHPILFGDKIIESGLLNVDQLIKNSKRIHESERTQELFNAFSDLNTTIIDLYAALTSPNQANYLVATEAELYRDDIALWKAGVPLGKYNEA
ncbi:MAG: hypothetical protein QXP01_09145, partial [Candidatus Hadarchaeum sp.]